MISSQLSSSDKPQFCVLVGVKSGTIDLVKLFPDSRAANIALDKVRGDYHPELDELQVFPVSLTNDSSSQIQIVQK